MNGESGLLATLLGLALSALVGALISHYYSARRRMSYAVRETRVLDPVEGKFPPEVRISFNNKDVARLSEWKIFVWNSGNQTISGDDLIDKELTIEFIDVEVVGTPAVSASRKPTRPSAILKDKNRIGVSFEYLDKGDAIGITVYTDRPGPQEDYDFRLSGFIKGIPKGVQRKGPFRTTTRTRFILLSLLVLVSALGMAVSMLVAGGAVKQFGLFGLGPFPPDSMKIYFEYSVFYGAIIFLLTSVLTCYWACVALVESVGPAFVRRNLA